MMTSLPEPPQRNSFPLTKEARRTLVRVLRVAFPHPRVPDGPYERTAETIIDQAEQSPWSLAILTQGLRSLHSVASGRFLDLDDAPALAVLRRIETTDFFAFVRRLAVLRLYDDHELWDVLGYQGTSFDKGGYLHRGFNDLDWLPEPRITEYRAAAETEAEPGQVPGTPAQPSAPVVPAAVRQRDTSNQPGEVAAGMTDVAR
jgi:hypothetical protein